MAVATSSVGPLSATRRKVKWADVALATLSHVLLVVLCLFAILPLVWAVSSAFKSNSEIITSLSFFPKEPTLEHFRFVLNQTNFPQWLRNSLIVSLSTTLLSLLVGSMAGYAMSRWKFRGSALYGNSLLVVQMFPASCWAFHSSCY